MRKIASFFLLVVTLMSCKNEKTEGDVIVVPTIENKSDMKMTVDLVVRKDDSLQLFYIDNDNGIFEEGKSVWAYVTGSDKVQKVTFNIPKDVLPSRLRMDFGQNRNQEPIEVKGFEISYLDKKFQAVDTLFYQYFIPNDQIEWDRKKAIAKFRKLNDKEFYDPSFNDRETLQEELKRLYE